MSASEIHVDVNLTRRRGPDGRETLVCRHCDTTVAPYRDDWRDVHQPTSVTQPSAGGPHLNDRASQYLDEPVVLRQGYCPGCYTALFTETLPARDLDPAESGQTPVPVSPEGATA